MSLSLRVYARLGPTAEELSLAMARRGWSVRVLSDGPVAARAESGPLGDCSVLGWCTAWAKPPSHSARLGDLPATHYAVVGLRGLRSPPPREPLRESVAVREVLAGASEVFEVWTTTERSQLALALQLALWNVLGELTRGVLYDEVTGGWATVEPRSGHARDAAAPPGPAPDVCGVGATAPDFELPAHDGSTFRLCAPREKPVALWFFPSSLDSPVCRVEGAALGRQGALLEKHVTMVGLGPFAPRELGAFASRHALRFPLLSDRGAHPSVVHGYGASQRRTTILVGTDGRVMDRFDRGDAERTPLELLKRLKSAPPRPAGR